MKFKSELVTQASGSIGGVTASRNRGGMYLRARSVPTNPGTSFQTVLRAYMATLTSLWNNTLTPTQRSLWDAYAEAVPLPDSLGEPRNVGGIGMYVRSNVPRLQASLDRVDDAPTTFNLGDFSAPSFGTISAAGGTAAVAFTEEDVWVDETGSAMLIAISRPQNPGINYFKGPYRYAGLIAGDDSTPPTTPASITLPFTVAEGQKVFGQIRVSRADGRLTQPFRLGAIAGA